MKNIQSIPFIAFLIVLYVARNAVPYAIYPLILLLLPFTIYQFVNIKEAKQSFVRSVKIFSPVILLILIELVAIFCTVYPFKGLPLNFLKEISFISIFLFLLSYHIRSKDDFTLLIEKIAKYFILFSIVIAILGLWKFFYSPSFISYNNIDGNFHFKWGSSLMSDYNFFTLFLLNGLIFGLYTILQSPQKIKYKVLFLMLLQIVIFTGFLSGSRRFIFCVSIFFIVSLLLSIPYLFKKAFSNTSSYKYILLFLGLSLFNLGFTYSFLSYFPLITEKAEKIFFIEGKNTDTNIFNVSNRINSAVSYYLIDVHKKEKVEINKRVANKKGDTISTETVSAKTVSAEVDIAEEIIPLTSSRQKLWSLGKEIYQEYSIPQKIFGFGFTFMDIFQKETEKYFYPHYLFLSVLLFSGIIGLIIYIAILLWSSIIYLFHLKKLAVLFFLFVINFIFIFFSFTDFFGASFYAFLFIIPLLYGYLHKYKKIIHRKIQKQID